MGENVTSLKRLARLAGLLYLILGVSAAYGIMYVSSQILIPEDSAATINNIRSKETLFRTGIVSHLISTITLLFLALVLYRILKAVDTNKAKLMVALVVVQVPVVFVIEILRISALMISKGETLKPLGSEQLHNLSIGFIKTHSYGIMILEIFWGLWLIPFGQLIQKSSIIPRLLGTLLIIAGLGYIIDSLTFILFPSFRVFTKFPALAFSAIGEVTTILWLLIKGVKEVNILPTDKNNERTT
ncbi:MAG TPA: DUF4386 domain-containing protein [Flavisolibacter sp.]|jgi:hypothetical protein|nr:DUF4386 domain-containing protein [Flavisolibacter sp.]